MRNYICVWVAMVAGCSSSSSGDGASGPEGFSCSPESRNGTYSAKFSERSGDCGPLDEQVVRLDASAPLPAGCGLLDPDTVSGDGCHWERHLSCADDVGRYEYTSVATQHDASGNGVTGIIDVTIRNHDGSYVCSSTYNVTWSRL